MAVDDQDAVEAVVDQAPALVEQALDEDVPAQRHRAGEVEMVRRVAVHLRRAEQRLRLALPVEPLDGAARDRLHQPDVGVDRQVVAVVLERRRRDHRDDVVAAAEFAELEPGVLAVVDARHAAHVGGRLGHAERALPAVVSWPLAISQQAAACGLAAGVARVVVGQRSKTFGQRGWKRQPVGMFARVGQLARQDLPRAPRADTATAHRQQGLGVRVPRVADHLLRRPGLDDPAEVHDRDPVAQRPRQPEVVRDEDQAEVEVALRPGQHVEHLGAHRHVERRDRLVADQRLGLEGHRSRDHHALALAAGQLVRVSVPVARGRCQPRVLERRHGAGDALVAADDAVDRERLHDQGADRLARVQRLVRVLEDHLHPAAHGAQVGVRERLAVDQDLARRRRLQAEQGAAERRLAAARLADDAEGLAAPPLEVDAVDGPDDPPAGAVDREVHLQVAHLDSGRRPGA